MKLLKIDIRLLFVAVVEDDKVIFNKEKDYGEKICKSYNWGSNSNAVK